MQWTDLGVSSSASLIHNCPQEKLKGDVLNAEHKVEMDFIHVKPEAKYCQHWVLFLHCTISCPF